MKKRSLVAAVAMLIVSAIVLTSATYAWFATGGPAQITGFTGNVATVSAGVFVKTTASGAVWNNSLTKDDLVTISGNHFVTKYFDQQNGQGNVVLSTATTKYEYGVYKPMSTQNPYAHTTSVPTIFAYNIDGINYNQNTDDAITDLYDVYDFWIGAASEDTTATAVNSDTTVDAMLTITGDAAAAARVMVFTSTDNGNTYTPISLDGTNPAYFSGSAETKLDGGNAVACWQPIIGALSNTKDATQDYIVKTNDTGDNLTSNIYGASTTPQTALTVTACPSGQTTATFQLPDVHIKGGYTVGEGASATTFYNTRVRVYVWLEGQDQDCVPQGTSVPGGAINVQWNFKLASQSDWT